MALKCSLGRKLLLLQLIPQWAIEQIITSIYQTIKQQKKEISLLDLQIKGLEYLSFTAPCSSLHIQKANYMERYSKGISLQPITSYYHTFYIYKLTHAHYHFPRVIYVHKK